MKVYAVDKEKNIGKLAVVSNSGYLEKLDFPLDTLFDWYPCCPRYDYKHSNKWNKLYIVIEENNKKLPTRYNVSSLKNRVKSKTACFKLGQWYNEEVEKENKKLFEFAESYDIVTPNKKDYSLEDINSSIKHVNDILDALYKTQEKNVRDNLIRKATELKDIDPDSKEYIEAFKEINEYLQLDNESQSAYVLSNLPQHIEELYAKFGEVYTMLNLMKKVV